MCQLPRSHEVIQYVQALNKVTTSFTSSPQAWGDGSLLVTLRLFERYATKVRTSGSKSFKPFGRFTN